VAMLTAVMLSIDMPNAQFHYVSLC
jgi:hypothetical protein